ncbi:MAG: hypothetical protein NVS2B3_04780 [Vulcanimicrobiaceae bacterium]
MDESQAPADVTTTPAPVEESGPIAAVGVPRTLGIDPGVEARRARAEELWQRVRGARESGETLTGVVTGTTNGGLLVELGGIRGFLPASQTRLESDATLESLVRTKVPLKVIDVDEKRHRVVVSHRRAVEAGRAAKRAEFLRSLALDQRHEGIVRRLADFGAFVDIGGIDGLIPMSELAFERVDKVGDILSVGDRVAVTIVRIEDGGRKIALSRKNALPDPWRDHPEVVRAGAVVAGRVVSKEIGKDAGLRIELAPGIVGSIRDSDADPGDYEIGEAIDVVVRYADRRTRRIKLGTVLGDDVRVSASGGFAPLGLELSKKR